MTGHFPDLGSALKYQQDICVEFLRLFPRRYFAGKPVWRREISAVFSGQTGCQPRIPVQGHGSWVPSIGSLSNDDGDVNENGIKAIGLDSPKKTTLPVHHAFLYIFLSRGCTTTTWNFLILRFVEDGDTGQQLSFSFLELWCSSLNSTPKISAIKFEAAQIHFLSDVFVHVVVVVA